MVPIERKVLIQVAEIVGPHSAAAQALTTAQACEAAGIEVRFWQTRGGILVEQLPVSGKEAR